MKSSLPPNETKVMKLSDLKPAAYNPRTISDESLAGLRASMVRFGVVQPIVFNKRTGNIVGGHQRVKVLIAEGEKTVSVVVVDIPEIEEKALNLSLNNPAIAGEFTPGVNVILDEVRAEIPEAASTLRLEEVRFEGEGGGGAGGGGVGGDPNEVPEESQADKLQAQWKTATGQLWRIPSKNRPGEAHYLICGDSTKREDLERLMKGRKADWMWTDPPYGVSYEGKTKDKLTIQNDGMADLPTFLRSAFNAVNVVLANGAPFYIAFPPGPQSLAFGQAVLDAGWLWHQGLAWVKDRFVLGHSDYHYQHEGLLYGWKPGEGHKWFGGRDKTSVLAIDRPARNDMHPTMKPVELVERCLENSTEAGSLGIEPFGGSGTTMVAAESKGRLCNACELDPRYAAVILERMSGLGMDPEQVK